MIVLTGAMSTYMRYPSRSIIHKVSWLNDLTFVTVTNFHFIPCLNIPIYQVPKAIPAWQAAFIEPLACSIHAMELGNIQLDDVVVISGCGPLGLGMVAAARLKNPKKLIALDLLEWKVLL